MSGPPPLKRQRSEDTGNVNKLSTIKGFNVGDFVTTRDDGVLTMDGGLIYEIKKNDNPTDSLGDKISLLNVFNNSPRLLFEKVLYKVNSEAEANCRKFFGPYALAFKMAFPTLSGGKRKTRKNRKNRR